MTQLTTYKLNLENQIVYLHKTNTVKLILNRSCDAVYFSAVYVYIMCKF